MDNFMYLNEVDIFLLAGSLSEKYDPSAWSLEFSKCIFLIS